MVDQPVFQASRINSLLHQLASGSVNVNKQPRAAALGSQPIITANAPAPLRREVPAGNGAPHQTGCGTVGMKQKAPDQELGPTVAPAHLLQNLSIKARENRRSELDRLCSSFGAPVNGYEI